MDTFDAGYDRDPFRGLCERAPTAATYPLERFRVEWGPIFHRGRLDGTARVLVIGQDPAAHEGVARRILCGVAGHRVQGFLAKLGIDRSYVMINAFLYSLYGTDAPTHTQAQLDDRFDWIQAILSTAEIEVVVSFGAVAGKVWRATSGPLPRRSAPAGGRAAPDRPPPMPSCWPVEHSLTAAHAALVHPDHPSRWSLRHRLDEETDLAAIPGFDLPAGLPGVDGGRTRRGRSAATAPSRRPPLTGSRSPSPSPTGLTAEARPMNQDPFDQAYYTGIDRAVRPAPASDRASRERPHRRAQPWLPNPSRSAAR